MKIKILKLTALMALALALFVGCAKEKQDAIINSDTEQFGPILCSSNPTNLCTGNYFADMETLFGQMGTTPPFQVMGKFDKMINCNIPYPVPCEGSCTGSIVLQFGENDLPKIDIFYYPEVPCSIADQIALKSHLLALAIEYAPICAATGQKYTPIAYDIYWQATGGEPGSFFLFAYVKYLPPCKGPIGDPN